MDLPPGRQRVGEVGRGERSTGHVRNLLQPHSYDRITGTSRAPEVSDSGFHLSFLTLAAEFDTPCVTFLMRPPTFPYFISPVTPSETSFNSPMGLPRKSTDPKIRAAWLRSSCEMGQAEEMRTSPCRYLQVECPEQKG